MKKPRHPQGLPFWSSGFPVEGEPVETVTTLNFEYTAPILGSMIRKALVRLFFVWLVATGPVLGQTDLPRAFVDGSGPGWKALGEDDFVNVNCADDTWSWEEEVAHATGTPTCVLRTKRQYTNFELVVQWQHLRSGGNSGVFVWSPPESHVGLEPNRLPSGVEVQILDPGFTEQWIKSGKKADFFSAHGDVFAVGASTKMTPFPPVSPNGTRSFPTKDLVLGSDHWNHYYVRAINGEIRLWVNGEEVSGGTDTEPASGYLCLESEGSPVQFKNLRIRELP